MFLKNFFDSGQEESNTSDTLQNQTLYFELFEDRISKTLVIAITVAFVIILVALNLGIIFYEKFGSDKKRTVLNKLFSSTAWAVSFYYIFGQLVEAFLYIHGPLPASFCLAHMIYKRAATTQVKSDNIRLVLPR